MGPVAGYLIDKLGPRRMVLIGFLIQGAGFLLFSQMHSLWQFYLAFIVMSMGGGFGTWLPVMTVLNNWFRRRRAHGHGHRYGRVCRRRRAAGAGAGLGH